MRILIVRLGSIGDIVHTLPAVAAIRKAMPHAEISWVVERRSAEILRDNPLLDRLIEVDTKALRRGLMSGETLRAPRQQLRRLRASAFDLALDLQGLLKSALIACLSGARRIFGFSRHSLREPATGFLLSKSLPVQKNIHVIRKNVALVGGALGIKRHWFRLGLPFCTGGPVFPGRTHRCALTNGRLAWLMEKTNIA